MINWPLNSVVFKEVWSFNSLRPSEHICIGNLTVIGSDNGLSPGRRQAIIWTNYGILLIGPLRTNFSEILVEIYIFSFKKMHLKLSSGNCPLFCLGLNVLKQGEYSVSVPTFIICLEVFLLKSVPAAPRAIIIHLTLKYKDLTLKKLGIFFSKMWFYFLMSWCNAINTYSNGLMQGKRNSIDNALSCINPSIQHYGYWWLGPLAPGHQ